MKRQRGSIAILVLMMGFLAHCGPSTIQIGVLLPLTGEQASYGKVIRQGIEVAAAEINEGGGVQGSRVELLFRDTRGDREQGKEATRELVDLGVTVIIGAVVSRVTLAVVPIIDENEVILLSPASSSPALSNISNYFFRNYPSDVLEGEFSADYVRYWLDLSSVVVLALDDVYSRGLAKVFSDRFTEQGRTVVETIFYDRDEDFSSLLTRLGALNFDAIYLAGYPHDMARALKALQTLEERPVIISVGAFNSPVIFEEAGEAAEGVIFPRPPFDVESSAPEVRRFVSRFRAMFDGLPDVFAAHGYDALQLIASAVERYGVYPDDLRLGLASTSGYSGVAGLTSFNEEGDVLKTPEMHQVQEGEIVPLE